MEGDDTLLRLCVPLEQRIAVALYRLSSTSELRTVAHLFGIGISTVHKLQYLFIDALLHFYKNTIKWPETEDEIEETVRDFWDLWGYPQCLGAIDGCHIAVSPPKEQATDYYNYKGWYSVVLLAVVDSKYRFRYVHIGTPGRVNDAFIFKNSNLKRKLESVELNSHTKRIEDVEVPVHLIGDSAFPLLATLMKPYSSSATMSDEETFDYRLSRARRVVENAFGRLKARFRIILKRMEMDISNVNAIIQACCILNNLCEECNDNISPEWMNGASMDSQSTPNCFRRSSQPALEVRKALTKFFVTNPLMEE